jgi:DNA-binding GntR family transcriptional regulator
MRLLARAWPFIWVEVLYEDALAANTTREEHRALVSLISEKRPDEAEEVLRRHLQTAKDHIINILKARENLYQEIPSPFNDADGRR